MGMMLRRHYEVTEIPNTETVKEVEETPSPIIVEEKVEEVVEQPTYKKWEITHMTTAEVTKVAKAQGIDVKDKSGAKIKTELINLLGL